MGDGFMTCRPHYRTLIVVGLHKDLEHPEKSTAAFKNIETGKITHILVRRLKNSRKNGYYKI